MQEVKVVDLHIRAAYVKFLSLFIFVLYIARYFILFDEDRFIFKRFVQMVDLNEAPIFYLLVFIASLYSLSLVLPKIIEVKVNYKFVTFLRRLFYIEFVVYIISVLFLGMRMGAESTILTQIAAFILSSIIPYNLVVFLLFLLDSNGKKLISLLFVIPSLLLASKSGIIHLLLIYIFTSFLKNNSIFNAKLLIRASVVYLLFPFMILVASYGRNGKGNVLSYVSAEFASFGNTAFEMYELMLFKLSDRITGLDVLLVHGQDNTVFSAISVAFYLIKGLFTASIFNALSGLQNIGMGRLFAIEFFKIPTTLVTAFEPTLFGVIYLSDDSLYVSALLVFTVLFILLFFMKNNNMVSKLMVAFFLYQLVLVIMTGLVTQLTQVLRFWVFLNIIYYFYIRLLYPVNLKGRC